MGVVGLDEVFGNEFGGASLNVMPFQHVHQLSIFKQGNAW
jgi:hypothetical protein